MSIKQLSIFVENKPGRAYAIADALSKNNINLSALSIADTSEYGIMRVIVDDPEKAKKILNESGVMVKITDVIAIPMDNSPGSLTKILEILTNAKISVRYMYAFVNEHNGGAVLVTKTANNDMAVEELKKFGISALDKENIF
ncbi:MAG: ACT domain-containing protein [Clostridia bacterium]|nr:ACT domain-containing protein [Clostridia bacterium]